MMGEPISAFNFGSASYSDGADVLKASWEALSSGLRQSAIGNPELDGRKTQWNPYRSPRPTPTLKAEIRRSQLSEFSSWMPLFKCDEAADPHTSFEVVGKHIDANIGLHPQAVPMMANGLTSAERYASPSMADAYIPTAEDLSGLVVVGRRAVFEKEGPQSAACGWHAEEIFMVHGSYEEIEARHGEISEESTAKACQAIQQQLQEDALFDAVWEEVVVPYYMEKYGIKRKEEEDATEELTRDGGAVTRERRPSHPESQTELSHSVAGPRAPPLQRSVCGAHALRQSPRERLIMKELLTDRVSVQSSPIDASSTPFTSSNDAISRHNPTSPRRYLAGGKTVTGQRVTKLAPLKPLERKPSFTTPYQVVGVMSTGCCAGGGGRKSPAQPRSMLGTPGSHSSLLKCAGMSSPPSSLSLSTQQTDANASGLLDDWVDDLPTKPARRPPGKK